MLTVDYSVLGLRAGESMLDLGCGAGRHSFEALRRGARTVCFDLDDVVLKDTVAAATAMLPDAVGQHSVAWGVRGDALRLPFADDTFDRVIASEVIEHIVDDASVFSEICRVLRPGGTAAVTVPRAWPERLCWTLSRDYAPIPGGHVRIYRGPELRAKLLDAGLVPFASHHSHALHSPYWWLKCIAGVDNEDATPVRLYRQALERQIVHGTPVLDRVERALNPVLGKSLAVYVQRQGERVAAG